MGIEASFSKFWCMGTEYGTPNSRRHAVRRSPVIKCTRHKNFHTSLIFQKAQKFLTAIRTFNKLEPSRSNPWSVEILTSIDCVSFSSCCDSWWMSWVIVRRSELLVRISLLIVVTTDCRRMDESAAVSRVVEDTPFVILNPHKLQLLPTTHRYM